jgi:plastocyanin
MSISGFSFSALTVKPGATVTVTNADSVAHTVKVDGTQLDVNVAGGGQATFTAPTKPGTYPLTCDFHPSMHGTLTVAA